MKEQNQVGVLFCTTTVECVYKELLQNKKLRRGAGTPRRSLSDGPTAND